MTDFDNELKRLEALVKNPKALKFSNIIDLNKRLRKYKYTDLSRGPVNKMYQTMANELGFDRYIVSAEDGIPKPIIDDPIFGIGRDGGFLTILLTLISTA